MKHSLTSDENIFDVDSDIKDRSLNSLNMIVDCWIGKNESTILKRYSLLAYIKTLSNFDINVHYLHSWILPEKNRH